jgi:hypothetical protein
MLIAFILALTVDDIVSRHIEARGGEEKLRAIETVVYSRGKYREGNYESEKAFMALARPYFKIVGNPEEKATFREGYDGSTWEWYEDPGIVIRTVGPAAAAGRHNIWVEGPFLDYRDKGTRIDLLGDGVVDNRPAFRLLMTLRDGFAREYFIDKETWLVTAERFAAPVHAFGAVVKSETRVGDYRPVGGVLFAHSYRETEIATGTELSSMQWQSIETNRKLPRSWFAPPAFTRTPLQALLEQLYAERTDVDALLWSYHEFRRAHKTVDTRDGIDSIGFQILKMKDYKGAIALLEANATHHPDAASSAFALGRAYATAGDAVNARRELERALALQPGHQRAAQELAKLK